MMQPWTRCSLVSICGVACLGLIPPALAVDPPKANPVDVNRPEVAVFQMLRSHPVTAPYPIATTWRAGQVVLSGRVGTKVVHDTAIRLAIASGHSVRDDLTIDTAAVYRTAGTSVVMNPPGAFPLGGAPYYVYPPPLFGRIDDPFYGFEPPLVSYPPWWPAVAAREPINLPAQAQGNLGQPDPGVGADPNAASPIKVPIGASADDGFVEMTIDPRGAAVLRGTVSTAADRVAIGQKIAQIPGINQVENLLNVGAAPSDTPPPPPEPAVPAPPPRPRLRPSRKPHPSTPRSNQRSRLTRTTSHNAWAGLSSADQRLPSCRSRSPFARAWLIFRGKCPPSMRPCSPSARPSRPRAFARSTTGSSSLYPTANEGTRCRRRDVPTTLNPI